MDPPSVLQSLQWQVVVVLVAAGLLILGLGIACFMTTRRLRRGVPGWSLRWQVPTLLVWLVGVCGGGASVVPLHAAAQWAYMHSPDGANVRALRDELRDVTAGKHPFVTTNELATPVGPRVATRFVTAIDLGDGWYSSMRPNPRVLRVSDADAKQGVLWAARSVLDRDSFAGQAWHLDVLLFESVHHFARSTEAQAEIARWVGSPPAGVRTTTVSGVVVQRKPGHRSSAAMFRVAEDVFTLRLSSSDDLADRVVDGALRHAVERALRTRAA